MNNSCKLVEAQFNGFPALELGNGQIQICVVPELGGKINSIVHLATKREWLWRNPHLPNKAVEYDASFVKAYDTGGLDECFPAVSEGQFPTAPWAGITIPDHGELWCQPWQYEIVASSAQKIVLKMECHGVRFPYRFERTLTMFADSPQLTLDYQVTNLTGFDMPFIWSIHPLMNIEPGMTLRLPAGVDKIFPEGSTPGFLGDYDASVAWPMVTKADGDMVDLATVPQADSGQAAKIYTAMLTGDEPVETALIAPDGEHAFTFRFKPSEITHVGLWMNYGAWSGCGSEPYFNLGLEPCIGDSDDLAKVAQVGRAAILSARQTRSWSLELKVS